MKKIYVAAPLFSEADKLYNEKLTQEIEKLGYECYLPQRNEAINDKTKCATSIQIYDGDTSKLRKSDIIVCLLDGPVVDPGVACEIGWFAGNIEENLKHKKNIMNRYGEDGDDILPHREIIGLFTDSRDGTKTPAGNPLDMKMTALNKNIAESQFPYVNLYIIGAIKKYGKLFSTSDDLVEYLKNRKN